MRTPVSPASSATPRTSTSSSGARTTSARGTFCCAAGYETDLAYPHWLAKVHAGDSFVDLIFSSGNAIAEVDDGWFRHARDGEVLGVPVRMTPVEETIWSKAFIMERERYDGADIAHLVHAQASRLDWQRLLRRFGPHWRVLLSHLVLFGFIYPAERGLVPAWVMDRLLERLHQEARAPAPPDKLCARHAAVARAVPARHRTTGLSRRSPHSARQHDRQRCGRVDRRDPRAAEAAATRLVVERTGTASAHRGRE